MGDLVTFSRSTSSLRRELPPGATAEILFFTGVRYYRLETEDHAAPPSRRRRSDKAKQVANERRRKH